MTTTIQEPKKNFVNVVRQEGRYTLGSSEVSACYNFLINREDAPKIWRSFTVDPEKDYISEDQTPLEIAKQIKDVYESYWIHSGVGDIKKMIEYLESIEEEESAAREAYELEYAKYQVSYWTERVNDLTHREE